MKEIFPERVLDASVEFFEVFAPRSRGVLHNATVRLINTTHCGPAPVLLTVVPPQPAVFPRGPFSRFQCWPL